ncbi:cob(I)yrinic acid a,c-diamide adenosyltransferase [Halococcoides cellulosivorans]|uniref:Cob(I)alamin adenolsyltransferase n=1 Tax=Halococcoides cellulosivorans TaxID=1679096 RepID=A0A2R4X135_9EURY|nr:cob(I)yrinic acid a,c-diamide adenosyltransferase [Halococcoides cellulosivorans]AWB27509.1 cob(I)alamin adenolsyltransferase [Halococcoides cellulosivorans]
MTDDTASTSDASTDDRPDPVPPAADTSAITPSAPEEFGLLQCWYGPGKGKTTAALGMAMRAAGRGYRVHVLQFMKGGARSVGIERGEYAAMAAISGLSVEPTGAQGWHRGGRDDEHAAQARAALDRTREIDAADGPRPLDAPADDGVHMLVLDEIGYALNRSLIDADAVAGFLDDRPDDLEVVATGGHDRPDAIADRADLVSHIAKEAHPFDAGISARLGTEF